MNLYNIHTHNVVLDRIDNLIGEYDPISILNVYPFDFEGTRRDTDSVFYSCGIHPWYSDNGEAQLELLKAIVTDRRVVALGEAGFDRLQGLDMRRQSVLFEKQVILSEEIQKPLIIHCTKAWDELLAAHKSMQPKQPWILHGYRGKPQLTEQLLMRGFYLSMGRYFNDESVRRIPLDRLFCETDTHRISIAEVYQQVANALAITFDELGRQVTLNTERVFRLNDLRIG